MEIIGRITVTLLMTAFVAYGTFGIMCILMDRVKSPRFEGLGGTITAGWVAIAAGVVTFVLGLIFIVGLTSKFA